MSDAVQAEPLAATVTGAQAARPAGEAPAVAPTGDDAVDGALGRLRGIDELGLRDQLVVFEAVHEALADRLSDAQG